MISVTDINWIRYSAVDHSSWEPPLTPNYLRINSLCYTYDPACQGQCLGHTQIQKKVD